MEEITVEISPSGDVKISVKGVKGKSCKELTKNLEEALGDVKESKTTREYNENVQQARVVNRGKA